MEVREHVEILRCDGPRLASAARRAGLDAVVPSCPDWCVRDVVRHTGGVHRWAASFVTARRTRPTTPEESATYFVEVGDDELVDWYTESHAALVETLESADPDLECWTFLEAPSPLAFWARRQAHETAVHRVDVESSTGPLSTIAPRFAADGVDELLTGFLRLRGRLVSDPARTLGVVSSDTDDAWTFRIEPDRREVSRGMAEADCVVRAKAGDLYLYLWNRELPEGSSLEVEGDDTVLELWREKARI